MIHFQASFFVLAAVYIALGYAREFLILFFAVTVHELSHIVTAKLFKLKCEKITVTPIGEIAIIKDMESLTPVKRALIILAGPSVNILLWLCTYLKFPFFADVNLSIGIFNLLPLYPLDGGKFIQLILGNIIGVLNTNYFIRVLSKLLSVLIILSGIVQLILYPYNISLLCIGFYLFRTIEKEYLHMTFTFYKMTMTKVKLGKIKVKKMLKAKTIFVNTDIPIKYVLKKLCWDYFFIIHITDDEKVLSSITEAELTTYITKKGISGNFGDLAQEK